MSTAGDATIVWNQFIEKDCYGPIITMHTGCSAAHQAHYNKTTQAWSATTIIGTGLVATDTLGHANEVRVATNTDSTVAVWKRMAPGNTHQIHARQYVIGASELKNGARIETTALPTLPYSPQVAMNAAGQVVTVWVQVTDSQRDVWTIRGEIAAPGDPTATIGWSGLQAVETNDENALYPQVAMDPTGNVMVVWVQADTGGAYSQIWAARYDTVSGWSAAERIDDLGSAARRVHIAVDGSGNFVAVWVQFDGIRDNIWANHHVPGTGWGSAEVIGNDSGGDADDPEIAMDSDGNAVAVWHQSDGMFNNDIWAARFE